jgi:hypothetical protein
LPAEPPLPGRAGEFSGERAWQHLVALVELGPRPAGSPANAEARGYLSGQLEALGLSVHTHSTPLPGRAADPADPIDPADPVARGPIVVRSLEVEISGTRHSGSFVLAAPFDSRDVGGIAYAGANDGASGAAVLLEVARVLAADPLPYTTRLYLLDGESAFQATPGSVASNVGSGVLIARLRDADVHLVVYLNQVGDRNLQISRNALSHRMYRNEFWKAAARLRRAAAFPSDGEFELGGARERLYSQSRLRQVVWIQDVSYGGLEPPGIHANVEQDLAYCSPESLNTVGAVTLEALDAISRRLLKIDLFATSPTSASIDAAKEDGSTDRPRASEGE